MPSGDPKVDVAINSISYPVVYAEFSRSTATVHLCVYLSRAAGDEQEDEFLLLCGEHCLSVLRFSGVEERMGYR